MLILKNDDKKETDKQAQKICFKLSEDS